VASDQQSGGLQLSLVVDRDTASAPGRDLRRPSTDTLYDAFGQRQVSTIFTQLNLYRVILEVAPQYQQNPEALDQSLCARAKRSRRAAVFLFSL